MQILPLRRGFRVTAVLAVTLFTLLSGPALPARERARSHVVRPSATTERATTWTNPAGESGSRVSTRTVDTEARTLDVQSTVTRLDGRTATRSLSRAPTEDGRTTSATATTVNGKTAAYESTTARTDSGYHRQASATGVNGQTVTKDVTVTKVDQGTSRTAVVTGPQGGTSATTTTTTRTP